MTSSSGSILVVGATQGTGRLVVQRLLQQGTTVSVLARSAEKARSTFGSMPVRIHHGDVTQPASLNGAFDGVQAIIYTLGVTKRPASEALIRSTEYDGTRNFLEAALAAGFSGRFIYMTSMGTGKRSAAGMLLNLIKGKTLVWRGRAERLIQTSGLPYSIVRAGVLNDQAGGKHDLILDQRLMGASLRYKISRADVARVLVEALMSRQAANTAFNVYWGQPINAPAASLAFDQLVGQA